MLRIENLYMKAGQFQLSDISFEVDSGEYFVLLGPSGSGKSLLLEAIAGVRKTESGKILLHDTDLTSVTTQKRRIGLVFQDNTAFPHLNVRNNIRYALRLKTNNRDIIDQKMRELSQNLMLDSLLDRDPEKLSGGELQRVLLARTMASEPRVLLLDEPLSSVDTLQKDSLKELLRKLNRQGQTILHVTHDYEEAVSLATHIGVMHDGKLLKTGTSRDILEKPGNAFIARFCGYKNYFKATLISQDTVELSNGLSFKIPRRKQETPCEIEMLISSTEITISKDNPASNLPNLFQARIKRIIPKAKTYEVVIDAGNTINADISHQVARKSEISENQKVWVSIPGEAIRII